MIFSCECGWTDTKVQGKCSCWMCQQFFTPLTQLELDLLNLKRQRWGDRKPVYPDPAEHGWADRETGEGLFGQLQFKEQGVKHNPQEVPTKKIGKLPIRAELVDL